MDRESYLRAVLAVFCVSGVNLGLESRVFGLSEKEVVCIELR